MIEVREDEIADLVRDEREVVSAIRRDAIDLVGVPVRSLLQAS